MSSYVDSLVESRMYVLKAAVTVCLGYDIAVA